MMKELEFSRAAPVLFTESTDSTNLQLKKLAGKGAAEGTVLIALRQSAGRGRMGRDFISPEGGVYLSMLLRPETGAEKLPQLSACAAVAVRRALSAFCGVEADIKWPNDLLLQDKKICGILAEALTGRELAVVLGIGINLNTPEEELKPELVGKAASVRALTGREYDRDAFCRCLVEALDELCSRWKKGDSFVEEYSSACVTLGKKVLLLGGDSPREAEAVKLAGDMSLLVRLPDGREEAVRYGEVTIRNG